MPTATRPESEPTEEEDEDGRLHSTHMLKYYAQLAEEQPSPALLKLYEGLPSDVVTACEQHREGINRDIYEHLRAVHDILAPYGLFHDWCVAAGLKYGAARYRLFGSNWTRSRPLQDPYDAAMRGVKQIKPPGWEERAIENSDAPEEEQQATDAKISAPNLVYVQPPRDNALEIAQRLLESVIDAYQADGDQ